MRRGGSIYIGNDKPMKLNAYITALEGSLGKEAQKELLPLQAGDALDTYAEVKD